jgi:glycogen debranching enzyme
LVALLRLLAWAGLFCFAFSAILVSFCSQPQLIDFMSAPRVLFYLCLWLLCACGSKSSPDAPSAPDISTLLHNTPNLTGRAAYLASPYVTAGDRLYVVGHQDGTFPDLGWHVEGEMGGIWDHPIKLMDGFTLALREEENTVCLEEADRFVNYPFANVMHYEGVLPELRVERLQFVPDGEEAAVVLVSLHNESKDDRLLELTFTGLGDLRPVWLGERNGMEDGPDLITFDASTKAMLAQDSLSHWYAMWGTDRKPQDSSLKIGRCTFRRRGQGTVGSLSYTFEVASGERYAIPFVIAGSYQSEDQVRTTLERVQENWPEMLRAKRERYRELARKAEIEIPDTTLQLAYQWSKYSTDWLIRDVPRQGRGLSAGMPDYPWWFGCDNSYSLQGVLATGRRDIVLSTVELIRKLSQANNGNGRIIHEASTNGVVYNLGNVNETPHFISLIWQVYQWTGDLAFLEEYYPTVQAGLRWLMEEGDANGNLLPDGFGMMEIHGLNSEMIDVATYTQQAFSDAARIADALDDVYQAAQYQGLADRLAARINEAFWVAAFQSYADFIGTAQQARTLIDDAIVRADTLDKPWSVGELEAIRDRIANLDDDTRQGFVLYHNWVVNTPMETGVADTAKALVALNTARHYLNLYGAFVTGIDRDETTETGVGSFAQGKKDFSYTGAVMTLPTGVLAIAENNYGRPDTALDYLRRMVRSFSYALPGSMYEVSPDYGMMAQAWNVYALAVPLVKQFFGVKPAAYQQMVTLQPQMPSAWDQARLRQLPVGNNEIGMIYERQEDGLQLTLTQRRRDWTLRVALPAGKYTTWTVDGNPVAPVEEGAFDVVYVREANAVLGVRF